MKNFHPAAFTVPYQAAITGFLLDI